jgi:hypothetical protein
LKPAPQSITEAVVLSWTTIDDRHRPTEKTRHLVDGKVQGAMAGLAICQYPEDPGFYLFYCDTDWKPTTDTWHATIEQAKRQAECEYEGTLATWSDSVATK